MKVMMVGAAGDNAGLVLPELKKRGATVCALVQHEAQADEAKKHGADEIALGDLNDAESLARAVDGVEGVFGQSGPRLSPIINRCQ